MLAAYATAGCVCSRRLLPFKKEPKLTGPGANMCIVVAVAAAAAAAGGAGYVSSSQGAGAAGRADGCTPGGGLGSSAVQGAKVTVTAGKKRYVKSF